MKAPGFILGTQYYRPPFPDGKHWDDDFARMRAAGFNAVQLWLVWGWCEPAPGEVRFDDYDRLADLAAKHGLGLVLAVLPELNPFWLAHELPDAAMVDAEGRPVLNCNRWECLSGVVPGACSDHPEARRLMLGFMEACARHFAGRPNLLAWDCWNENRWCNQAPEFVCYCAHSMAAFRRFLEVKYGGLDGLGRAWGRRYQRWEHVRPGRLLGHSYPEMHDYVAWITERAREMAEWRVAAIRAGDPRHPVGTHTGTPTVTSGQNLNEILFSRGIDRDVAAGDLYGYSSFPKQRDPYAGEAWTMRTAMITESGIGKPIWMSELQGGPTALARTWGAPLPGAEQQAWVWSGISQGARAVIFWCWRNEVFGIESNGFGLLADDGFADDRLKALGRTASVLREKEAILAAYRPDAPEIGVLFQRDSYFYGWMHRHFGKGDAPRTEPNPTPPNHLAYARALETLHLPHVHLDDRHLPAAGGALRLVIVPDPIGLDDAAAQWLVRFAQEGGTVFIEGGAGMRGPDTFHRAGEERPFYRESGLIERICRGPTAARRTIPAGALGNAEPIPLALDKLETGFAPEQEGNLPLEPDGFPMLQVRPVGKGRIVALGSVVGRLTWQESPNALRALVASVAGLANARAAVGVKAPGPGFCACRLGRSGERHLLFVTNYQRRQDVVLRVAADRLPPSAKLRDWAGHSLRVKANGAWTEVALALEDYDWATLEW